MASSVDDLDSSKAPLLDHIIELRNRLMYSVAALAVGFVFCFYFSEEIYRFLMQPLANALSDEPGRRMIYTALHEAFFTYVKVAFWAACFLAFPVIASQIYMFVAPGLYRNEKRAFVPFLIVTPILFLAGGAMVYYGIMPLAWRFFLSFETPAVGQSLAVELEPKVNEYLSLVMKLIFAFGLCFQLPVLLTLLARVGIASSAGLKAKRKYAWVMVFIIAAVLTPPDPISQISLAVPILLLYEISILCARVVEKKRAEREAAADAEDEAADES